MSQPIHSVPSKPNVAILGARGYSGRELAKILLRHPRLSLKACFSRDPNWKLSHDIAHSALYKSGDIPTYPFEDLATRAEEFQTLFLATPTQISIEVVSMLSKKNIQIIDLSGAFRLDQKEFESYYQMSHGSPEFLPHSKSSHLSQDVALNPISNHLNEAQYGLIPWSTLSEDRAKDGLPNFAFHNSPPTTLPKIVANPGCYATSVLMALIPLLRAQVSTLR